VNRDGLVEAFRLLFGGAGDDDLVEMIAGLVEGFGDLRKI
jgi:hypothetical protein